MSTCTTFETTYRSVGESPLAHALSPYHIALLFPATYKST